MIVNVFKYQNSIDVMLCGWVRLGFAKQNVAFESVVGLVEGGKKKELLSCILS